MHGYQVFKLDPGKSKMLRVQISAGVGWGGGGGGGGRQRCMRVALST